MKLNNSKGYLCTIITPFYSAAATSAAGAGSTAGGGSGEPPPNLPLPMPPLGKPPLPIPIPIMTCQLGRHYWLYIQGIVDYLPLPLPPLPLGNWGLASGRAETAAMAIKSIKRTFMTNLMLSIKTENERGD